MCGSVRPLPRSVLRSVVLALAFCGAAADGFAQDVTLQYHWTAGDESRTRMTQQTSTTIPAGQLAGAGGGSIESTMTQVFRTLVEAVAADGSATLQQVIESVRVEMRLPSGTIQFDSETPGADASTHPMTQAMSAAYRAMIGQPVRMVVSPAGAVQKVEGFSRLLERVLNAQPMDRVAPEMLDGFRNVFHDDATRDMLGWGVAPFPDRPLHPGDTWQDRRTATIPIVGTSTARQEWTLRDVARSDDGATARLTATMTIEPDPSAPPPTLGPMPMPLRVGASSGEGDVLFDLSRGRVQRATTTLLMPATMSLRAGADTKTVELRITSKVTLEVIEPAAR
jgi:Family of unknown function (DUF6263)